MEWNEIPRGIKYVPYIHTTPIGGCNPGITNVHLIRSHIDKRFIYLLNWNCKGLNPGPLGGTVPPSDGIQIRVVFEHKLVQE